MEIQQNGPQPTGAELEVKKARPVAAGNKVPKELLEDKLLNELVKVLPSNYNFEVHKSIWRINETKKSLGKEVVLGVTQSIMVHLQFPEGLLHHACIIADILKTYTGCEFAISGDVTYGACCVDDFTAEAIGAEFIVHYAHSCLVPINEMRMKALYVFVDILIDMDHFVATVDLNFEEFRLLSKPIFLLSTIQFNASVFRAKELLESKGFKIIVPQEKPRSAGETLGCTAPELDSAVSDTVLYLCDGRFHMEAVMIANPSLKYLQYNPYTKKMTIEKYDFERMIEIRQSELQRCKIGADTVVGLIMGVLGRQGSPHIIGRIRKELDQRGIKYITILVSEISVEQLRQFGESIQFFVQVACPRLSIDWGKYYDKPMLTSYEFYTLIDKVKFNSKRYPMDFYSDRGGEWTNFFHKNQKETTKLKFEDTAANAALKAAV